MMTCKENQEITAFHNKSDDSKERVISAVQRKYSAIQIMTDHKRDSNEEERCRVMDQKKKESDDLLQSFDADDPLKAMLVTQMAVIHDLQQKEFLFASQIISPEKKQYHINAVTKLSNIFIQQATLMQKLQGKGQQKVTVEHVHVHNGGQAIVGNVETNGREG